MERGPAESDSPVPAPGQDCVERLVRCDAYFAPETAFYFAAAGMFSSTQSSLDSTLRLPESKAMRRPSG